MRLGVLLPTFRSSPSDALAAAASAEALGLDGVFAYDHLWPMGSPDRPAIAPFEVLAVVAARQPTLTVGPLVARVGLVADEVLLGQARALSCVAPGRTIVAVGTGDKLSKAENLAYGLGYESADERRASLRGVAAALLADGVTVWVGDGAPATRAVATALGCALNVWDAPPDTVAQVARVGEVTWAGPAPRTDGTVDAGATGALLAALDEAGATWAVLDPGVPLELVARLRPPGGRR